LGLLFKTVTVTTVIAEEFGKELPHFIKIKDTKDQIYQKMGVSFHPLG